MLSIVSLLRSPSANVLHGAALCLGSVCDSAKVFDLSKLTITAGSWRKRRVHSAQYRHEVAGHASFNSGKISCVTRCNVTTVDSKALWYVTQKHWASWKQRHTGWGELNNSLPITHPANQGVSQRF